MLKNQTITLEYFYNCSVKVLWNALTQPTLMKQWYFNNIPDFKAEVGFSTAFLIENEGRKFTHQFTILEVLPFQKLKHTWNFKEHKGDATITFEVNKVKNTSKLNISFKILEEFPELPEFTTENCIAGWNYFLGENLKKIIETK